jgi:D-alanine-D-alanine ligase
MDKRRTKLLWRGSDLPTPAFRQLRERSDLDAVASEIGLPVMIKPNQEGSSLGMTRVEAETDLEAAWQQALAYDSEVFAERLITGEEYTVALLGGTALPSIRIEAMRRFYDFQAKYEADDTRMHCPSGLSDSDEAALASLAATAFDAVGGRGWGRVDLMRDSAGGFWLLEVNTIPGMTDHSLVPAAASVAGIDMDELVWRILLTSARGGGDQP